MSLFSKTWDERFLNLAETISTWSKDPSTKVGAVIVRPDKTIASVGYNGFPRHTHDTYTDRETKLLRTVHAELNAILNAREPLRGCTLYVTPLSCCANCTAAVIQAGIKYVVARALPPRPEWQKSMDEAAKMFKEAAIDVRTYDWDWPNV